jgi:osmotically-inducible protein OsmY
MSLECEVRAALASDDEIWRNQEVTVNAYDGIIILRGTTKNKQLRDLIVDTTSKVKGVKECKSDISLLSDGLTK